MSKNKNKIPNELAEILNTMDVPMYRKEDIPWLARNLGIRNSNHPKFQTAMLIIKSLMSKQSKKSDMDRIFGK